MGGKACQGWGIYVAGRFTTIARTPLDVSDPNDLRDDLKFTELAATTLGALRDVRMLERQRAGLSQFFSPVVLEALQGVDPEVVLAPRETEVVGAVLRSARLFAALGAARPRICWAC